MIDTNTLIIGGMACISTVIAIVGHFTVKEVRKLVDMLIQMNSPASDGGERVTPVESGEILRELLDAYYDDKKE